MSGLCPSLCLHVGIGLQYDVPYYPVFVVYAKNKAQSSADKFSAKSADFLLRTGLLLSKAMNIIVFTKLKVTLTVIFGHIM